MKTFHLMILSVAVGLVGIHIGNVLVLAYNAYDIPVSTINFNSPLKQFKSGISANNMLCNEGLQQSSKQKMVLQPA
jgi:hypothetical protein